MNSRFPTSMDELLKLVEGTEFEAVARDEAKLQQLVYDAMKTSDDPMTREIGEGLASGTITPMTIASTSAYAGFLDDNLQALQRFDGDALVESLEILQAEAKQEKADEARQRDDDDGEDLWQGLGRNNR